MWAVSSDGTTSASSTRARTGPRPPAPPPPAAPAPPAGPALPGPAPPPSRGRRGSRRHPCRQARQACDSRLRLRLERVGDERVRRQQVERQLPPPRRPARHAGEELVAQPREVVREGLRRVRHGGVEVRPQRRGRRRAAGVEPGQDLWASHLALMYSPNSCFHLLKVDSTRGWSATLPDAK